MSHGQPRRAARRDANERSILEVLDGVGATYCQIDGQPFDLIIGYRGEDFLWEIKSRSGKLRERQARWKNLWRGRAPQLVRSPEEAVFLLTGKLPDTSPTTTSSSSGALRSPRGPSGRSGSGASSA